MIEKNNKNTSICIAIGDEIFADLAKQLCGNIPSPQQTLVLQEWAGEPRPAVVEALRQVQCDIHVATLRVTNFGGRSGWWPGSISINDVLNVILFSSFQ